MHVWQRSLLYRLWVVVGLLAVAGTVIAIGLSTQPGDEPPYLLIGLVLGTWLLGILVLQGRALVRDGPAAPAPADPGAPLAGGRLPASADGMRALLALPDPDGRAGARSRRGQRAAWSFALAHWIPTALVAVLLPLSGLLFVSGVVDETWRPFGETGPGIPVASIPGLAIVALMVVLLPRTLGRARAIADDHLAPLGLRITHTPTSILLPRVGTEGVGHHVVGPTTMEGRRHGRPVVVEAHSNRTAVLVASPVAPFEARGDDRRLVLRAGEAPWLSPALAALPADRRWKPVTVRGGADGIRVDRPGSGASEAWLTDLWLAERLADAAR